MKKYLQFTLGKNIFTILGETISRVYSGKKYLEFTRGKNILSLLGEKVSIVYSGKKKFNLFGSFFYLISLSLDMDQVACGASLWCLCDSHGQSPSNPI